MEKQNALPKGEDSVQINEYYLGVSKKLRGAKYLSLLFMVAALILTLWAYRSRLTYDNFRYILRDIDEAGHATMSTDSVYYSANDTNFYTLFRGDFAVGSSDGVSFHRALGSLSFEDKISFKSPILAPSDKYMLAYDSGGKSFYVYNSLGRVYNETLKHGIVDCAASADGHFAVLTKSDVGDFVVRIYNKDFALVGEVTRAGYAYSVGFTEDGRLFIFEGYSSLAAIYTDILFYTVGAEDIDGTVTVQGLALECGDFDGGTAVISSSCITVFDKDFATKDSYSFGTSDVLYGAVCGKGICVLLDKNEAGAQEEAVLYTSDESVKKQDVPYGAKGITLCGNKEVLLYSDRLFVCDGENSTEISIADGAKKLLLMDKRKVVVCYSDYAKVVEVN